MKRGILLLLLISSVFAHGQSIKEALFRGKLKNDPGTVIRKGDDLSAKMVDSTQKAAADSVAKAVALAQDSSAKRLAQPADSATVAVGEHKDSAAAVIDTAAAAATAVAPAPIEVAPAPKNNNTVWKQFADSVVSTLKGEALSNKKIKKGTYYITATYSIETDGKVNIVDVYLQPENSLLQSQVRTLLETDTPHLEPVLTSNGTPRKVTRKYNFTVTKE